MAVKFDYAKTLNQAKALEKLAADMQNQSVKKLGEVYENINASWSGQAAKTYLKYIGLLREDLGKKSKYLQDTASFLRETAKKMKAADDAAKQAAQSV